MNDQKSKKILLIDDDPDTLNALEKKLISSGFEVIKAMDGQEGLDSALANHPDLIILDIVMPKMDGITTLKKLREDDWGRNVSVIILTNINENEKLAQALEIGVDEYMIKSNVKLADIAHRAKKLSELI